MIEKLLTKKDVASVIGTTETVVAAMVSKNQFPRPHHLGKKACWPESVVKAWIDLNLVAPDDDDTTCDHRLSYGGGTIYRPLRNLPAEGGVND